MRRTVWAAVAILFAGCAASEWQKAGGTPEMLKAHTASCTTSALEVVPINMQLMSVGWEVPPRRECTSGANQKPVCTTIPGVPASPRLLDVNETKRKKAVDFCLRQLGWSK